VATTVIDAGLFALCTLVLAGTALVAARWTCGAIGAVANFALNRAWAFRARNGSPGPQAARYGLTAFAAVSLATLAWWLLREATGWDPRLLHLMSMAVVWVAFTYPLLRSWVLPASTTLSAGAGGSLARRRRDAGGQGDCYSASA
jgi:putative flippase GtrA